MGPQGAAAAVVVIIGFFGGCGWEVAVAGVGRVSMPLHGERWGERAVGERGEGGRRKARDKGGGTETSRKERDLYVNTHID